jgi:hypothetical protein
MSGITSIIAEKIIKNLLKYNIKLVDVEYIDTISMRCRYFLLFFDLDANRVDVSFSIINKQKETAICMKVIYEVFASEQVYVGVVDDFYLTENTYYKIDDNKYLS